MKFKYPVENIHSFSIEEVVQFFETDTTTGISPSEAEARTKEFGPNSYHHQKEKSIWLMILLQFKSPIVYLLFAGAAVGVYFKDYIEAIAILVVIFVNALIGFLMELQARNSMNALKEMDVILSKVMRDSKIQDIPSEKLVPGDIIILEAGDVIPGDGRLVELNQLQCDESSLTGESIPTVKSIEKLPSDAVLGDQHNMVFKGAFVMNGNGKAVITGISQHTQLGIITSLVEKSEDTITPLDRKLSVLSKRLIWLTLFLTLVFAITGILQGKEWILIIKTSIALAVAAFPEGLPIVSTVALAYGMLHMARRNAIVKKLSAVETLGSTNVILTDKTGTLTENKIYVNTFSFPEEYVQASIDGTTLKFDNGQIEKSKENFEKLKLVGALCNNASTKADDEKKVVGDPIEIALVHLSNTSGTTASELKEKHERIAEVPFNSDTKIMGTMHKTGNGQFVAAKGSVEHIVEKCNRIQTGATNKELNDAERKTILSESERMAAEGLRVLAFAYREETSMSEDNFLNDLIYIGMIGFLDPPRLDIKGAMLSCKNAGIKIVMITGDHPMTALNIAKKVGLANEEDKSVMIGKDLPSADALTQEWKDKILSTTVFARTTPKQKLDIADVYQQAGNVVAMTGDGVNDAPALKKADVGIAMGLRGTAVAKETASIVLKDDSFNTIAEAVFHGRVIFQNIQRFVIYLVSCNLSEIFIVMTLGFVAPSSILLPLQILFLNMVTDVFPALALGLGDGDKSVMGIPPRDKKRDIISTKNWITIGLYAIAMTMAVIAAMTYCRWKISTDPQEINSISFLTLAFSQLFHVFNMSSPHSPMWVNDVTKNKFVWLALLICIGMLMLVYAVPQMRMALGLATLAPILWVVAIVAGLLPLLLVQVYKAIWERSVSRATVK